MDSRPGHVEGGNDIIMSHKELLFMATDTDNGDLVAERKEDMLLARMHLYSRFYSAWNWDWVSNLGTRISAGGFKL